MAHPSKKVNEDFFESSSTKVVEESFFSDEPVKKKGGTTAQIGGGTGGVVGSSKAQSSVSIEPPNPKDNPFAIGQQFNQPPKLEAERLDLSDTKKKEAIAEQIKTPLRKIPLTPILDQTKIEKPISDIDANEAIARQKQHKIDMETAIDNTTLKVLKQKGIVAGKGSPYYEAERKKIEAKTKPTMIGGIVINGAEATYHKDKDGNIGLDRNLGFLEGIRKGFNTAVEGEDEANAFAEMDTKQKVEYANKQMEGKPTEYMEERGGVGELLGGAAPYLVKAAAAGTLATAAGIAAPETGGASLVGVAPVLTVLLTAPDMIKQGAKDEILTRYQQLKQENPLSNDEDLMRIAQQGEISGGILGAAEALAFTTTLKLPIAKESKDVLTNYMKGVASSAVHLGGIMSGTTAAKIAERKLEGYNVKTDEAIDEITTAFTENATAGAILNGVISGVHTLPKVIKSAMKYALKDTPTSEIKTALQANVEAGRIPPEVAEQTIADIEGYKVALAKTADGLKPETQASVAGLIQARDNVAAEMATKDPTQRAVYEQKIEAYNKQIEKITETNDPLKYEIDEVTGNPINKVAPKVEDTKLSEPLPENFAGGKIDEQGVPIGKDVPPPTETKNVEEANIGYEDLPQNVKDIVDKYGEANDKTEFNKKLEEAGYETDYDFESFGVEDGVTFRKIEKPNVVGDVVDKFNKVEDRLFNEDGDLYNKIEDIDKQLSSEGVVIEANSFKRDLDKMKVAFKPIIEEIRKETGKDTIKLYRAKTKGKEDKSDASSWTSRKSVAEAFRDRPDLAGEKTDKYEIIEKEIPLDDIIAIRNTIYGDGFFTKERSSQYEFIVSNKPKEQPSNVVEGKGSGVGGDVEATAKALENADLSKMPNVSFHGSKNKELIFGKPKEGKDRKSNMQLDFGTHFTSEDYASFYTGDNGKKYAAIIDLKNPLNLTQGVWWKDDPNFAAVNKLITDLKLEKEYGSYDYYDKDGNKQQEVQSVSINAHKLNGKIPKKVSDALKANGFDGIIYEPYHPQGGGKYYEAKPNSFIVLDNSAIKEVNPKNIAEAYHKAKKDGTNPELVKAVEQLLPTQEGKVEQPIKLIAKLEAERDAEIDKVSKPDLKLELVKTEDLVNSKDPIGNREKHNELKERYKQIRKLIDCL